MSISYLWRNRTKPRILSRLYLKVWAKRFYRAPQLIRICFIRRLLRIRGASIGELSIIGRIKSERNLTKLHIGHNTSIGENVDLMLHAPINIGNNVVINDNVSLLTGSHDTHDEQWLMISKEIVIADYAWIARNAIILPGVTVGYGSIVAAGAVVSKNVEDFAIVGGNPAKKISSRVKNLTYSPVEFVSAYEAWLGRTTTHPIKH